MDKTIRVASIQIAPVFLDATKTWLKLAGYIRKAHAEGATFITWGETLIPGYPCWVSMSKEAVSYQDEAHKQAYAKYWKECVTQNSPIVAEMKQLSLELGVKLMGGVAEKEDTVNSSLYCTLLAIANGRVVGRHRKLKPTFHERLIWAQGDGQLQTYPLFDDGDGDEPQFFYGGLNCWENWMPYARSALHLQNEVLHVAVWPGNGEVTKDITRFIALEGRSWVVSTSGLLRVQDCEQLELDLEFPTKLKQVMAEEIETWGNWLDGGSMIVNPKGEVVSGPLIGEEGILYADVDPWMAIRERYNFDYSGHYSRFDVFNKPIPKIQP